MVEVYDFIRASLLLRAGRKENIHLPLFLLCVCLLSFGKKFLSILGSRLSSLVEAQSLAIILFFRNSFLR